MEISSCTTSAHSSTHLSGDDGKPLDVCDGWAEGLLRTGKYSGDHRAFEIWKPSSK